MSSTPHTALRVLRQRSVEIIAEHQEPGGAYPASPVFPVYRYSWLRDGAFIADGMSRTGATGSANGFFGWCSKVLTDRAERIVSLVERARRGEVVAASEHLPTRYTLDGSESDAEWWDFQLDGYGTWMWALEAHARRHGAPVADAMPAVALCTDYLSAFWGEPCYDWWEEHADGVHVSTLAAVYAGLRAAVALGVPDDVAARASLAADGIAALVDRAGIVDGHLVKTIGAGPSVDASLVACAVPFGLVEPGGAVAEATYRFVAEQLAPDGVHRYLADTYYGGGRWVLLAGFVGWYEAQTGRTDAALRRLQWMHDRADADGLLPEQVSDDVLAPAYVPQWERRWGPVARPLLWSHAMYLTLAEALELSDES